MITAFMSWTPCSRKKRRYGAPERTTEQNACALSAALFQTHRATRPSVCGCPICPTSSSTSAFILPVVDQGGPENGVVQRELRDTMFEASILQLQGAQVEDWIRPLDAHPAPPTIKRARRNVVFLAHAFNRPLGASFFQNLLLLFVSESRAHPSTMSDRIRIRFRCRFSPRRLETAAKLTHVRPSTTSGVPPHTQRGTTQERPLSNPKRRICPSPYAQNSHRPMLVRIPWEAIYTGSVGPAHRILVPLTIRKIRPSLVRLCWSLIAPGSSV